MKFFKFITLLSFVALLMANCSSTKHVSKSQLTDKWILKSINNRPVSQAFPNKTPYLLFNFQIDQVSGNGGCNTFTGKFTYNGGTFQAPNIASTMMACIDTNDESLFFELLGKPSKLSIMNGELIFSQDDKPVLIFTRAEPLGAVELEGGWKLASIEGSSVSPDQDGRIPTIIFDFATHRVNGNTGCNTYNSTFSLSKNVLDIKPLVTTRMACPNMDAENKFVNLLHGVTDIDLENDMLVLRRDNKTIMTFVK